MLQWDRSFNRGQDFSISFDNLFSKRCGVIRSIFVTGDAVAHVIVRARPVHNYKRVFARTETFAELNLAAVLVIYVVIEFACLARFIQLLLGREINLQYILAAGADAECIFCRLINFEEKRVCFLRRNCYGRVCNNLISESRDGSAPIRVAGDKGKYAGGGAAASWQVQVCPTCVPSSYSVSSPV
jgi:hypothetical protein